MGATIKIAILANAKNAINEFNKTSAAAKTTGQKIKGGFQAAAGPAMGALAGLGAAAFKFGQDASEMSDSISAIQTVLGPASKDILAFSDTTASALGISKQVAIDAGLAFGNIGKTAGLQGPALSKFTTDLIGRAGDVASQLGGTSQEAVEAFGSALRGEFEPARKYGVLLNDDALKAEALSMGLIKATGDTTKIAAAQVRASGAQLVYGKAVKKFGVNSTEAKTAGQKLALAQAKVAAEMKGKLPASLTVQQKALAAQSAILKQTGAAQGDFANTAESAKNQQEKLKAELANTSAELGMQLLPFMSQAASTLSDMLGWVKENQGAFKAIAGAIGAVAAIILVVNGAMKAYAAMQAIVRGATLVWTGIQWLLNTALLANPITWIVLAIIALIAIIYLIATRTTWFQTIWKHVWGFIKATAVAVFNFLKAYFVAMFRFYKAIWDYGVKLISGAVAWLRDRIANFVANVKAVWARILGLVATAIAFRDRMIATFKGWLDWMLALPGRLIDGMVEGLKAGWGKLVDFFEGAVDEIPESIMKLLQFGSPPKVMVNIGLGIAAGLVGGIKKGLPALRKTMGVVASTVAGGVSGDAGILGAGKVEIAAAGGVAAGGNTFHINVNVAPGADPAETGREVVKAIDAWQRQTGRVRLVPA
jgi:hypothetical protein